MPKLWNETIEAHRRDVHDAILQATWALVTEHGPLSVTMSQIAEKAGIGRATLYKYFPDVEAILHAWHQRHIAGHLEHLGQLHDGAGNPMQRLEAVLNAYALICRQRTRPDAVLAALLHRGDYVDEAQQHVHDLVKQLMTEAAATGSVRDDVKPEELASFCVHALMAAGSLRSEAAVRRLVAVTLDGLRP
ncbi:TetR/AcrR family transcriptional regulator [Kibdelosporangium aridum]|uniref:TetR/AcrR family transcriptional regulator n=1 Tax=Kibdelosporangium aridum TaxID=2030 RepID=A0A428YCG8_KIBAR|nr:TetR/AcrR family transcriptional regulator [Kibdelosporangium aridum]RSM65231.1 TetR/AcrR family transcriptional regulator [Kibdelosporangium aridum]